MSGCADLERAGTSALALGRVKTKSDLVVVPSGRQIFAFFCSPHDHRAQNFGCGYTAWSFYTARAQEDKSSANYMLPYCRAAANNQSPTLTIDAVLQGMCVGIFDAIDFMMSEYPPEEQEYRSCPPSDVILRQAVQMVIAYIDARPERMNENFKKLAIEAIHDAWPCGTN